MRLPPDATPGVRAALKIIHERLDRLGVTHAPNMNLKGNRATNAGPALAGADYVTLDQLTQLLGQATQQAIDASTAATTTDDSGGVVDDGQGANGCANCGSDGHATGPATEYLAGQIVCGTANEFPALLLPTVDQPTRDANTLQLLLRMIWHLNLAFTAGRQRNPSSAISGDKLTVLIGGVYHAYDVMSLNDFTIPVTVHMLAVGSPDYVAEAGTAD